MVLRRWLIGPFSLNHHRPSLILIYHQRQSCQKVTTATATGIMEQLWPLERAHYGTHHHIVTPKSVTEHIGARNVWHGTFFHTAQPPLHRMHRLHCTLHCSKHCIIHCFQPIAHCTLHTAPCTAKPNCSTIAIMVTNADAAFKSCKVTSPPPQYQSWHPLSSKQCLVVLWKSPQI